MNRPVHALVLGLTLSLLAPASFASVLETKGSPEPNVTTMPAYGMDVATRMGLKTVIPSSWQLFVHRSVSLPETMNWNRGEAWPAVLTKFAADNHMSVLIDWDNHVVMLRSPEQALEEGATRQEIAQAATTPLPQFGTAAPKATKAPALAQAQPNSVKPTAAGAAPSTDMPTFNIVTAPEQTRTVAQRPAVEAAKASPVAPALAAKPATTPAPTPSLTASKVLPSSIAHVSSDKPMQPAGAAAPAVVARAIVDKQAQAESAQKVELAQKAAADTAAKLAAAQQARALEDAKLVAAQKARSEEDAKLAAAQKAREAVAVTLSATQKDREAAAAKLAEVQKERDTAAAKLADVQKERDAATARLADVQKANNAEVAKLADVRKASEAEAAKLAELKKAREAEAAKLVAAQTAAKAAVVAIPVIRVNPTPAMVVSQQEAAKAAPAVALASTDEFSYTAPVALNRPSARNVAQAIANRFNLRLVYAANEYALRGPVTLLAESAEQDVHLLGRAIGTYGPVVLEVDAAQKILRVMPRNATPQQLAEIRARRPVAMLAIKVAPTATPAAAAVAPAPVLAKAPTVTVNAVPAVVVSTPAPAAVAPVIALASETAKPATDTVLTLELEARQPLEDALTRFSSAQNYTIEWKVSGGFEANRSMSFTGRNVREVLSQVLPKLGLSADIYTREKHIVVRPGDAARDR